MEIDGNKVLFSTGREKNAHGGIIGLSPDMQVTDGYDGEFYRPKESWMDDDDYSEYVRLTPEERVELADYMITAWKRFRSKAIRS